MGWEPLKKVHVREKVPNTSYSPVYQKTQEAEKNELLAKNLGSFYKINLGL